MFLEWIREQNLLLSRPGDHILRVSSSFRVQIRWSYLLLTWLCFSVSFTNIHFSQAYSKDACLNMCSTVVRSVLESPLEVGVLFYALYMEISSSFSSFCWFFGVAIFLVDNSLHSSCRFCDGIHWACLSTRVKFWYRRHCQRCSSYLWGSFSFICRSF